ncbi:tumor necrosis factor alpha-induced protein 2 isoform X2 [Amia ocellicauda]|uniref:tumor necrosis factor alpha-induced protein 2 isoform X2 n=1 Tax=Amia ocellicauda TaxID=2972642 RepID=UPI003464DEFA
MAQQAQGEVEAAEVRGSDDHTATTVPATEAPGQDTPEDGGGQADGLGFERPRGVLGKVRRSFRESFRKAAQATSPTGLLPFRRRSKDEGADRHRPDEEDSVSKTGSQPPDSPSQRSGGPHSPEATSPFKKYGRFSLKARVENGSPSPDPQPPSTPNSDAPDSQPVSPAESGSPSTLKKGGFGRFSLRLKKDKGPRVEALQTLTEALSSELLQEERSEKQPKSRVIPSPPLSVMQISKLIDAEVLEDAHLNLLSLRLELQAEKEAAGEAAGTIELARKEKDLNLLYGALRDKVRGIVRDSTRLPGRTKELLGNVATIIEEEDGGEGGHEVSGPETWKETWTHGVQEGVQATIQSVQLDAKEQDPAWLSVHLGLLGAAIVGDLQTVKKELQAIYPPSFAVFSTYRDCYHQAISQHLKQILQRKLDVRDSYHLLQWTIGRYPSEKIMGSPSLQPEMGSEGLGPLLDQGEMETAHQYFLEDLQEKLRTSLKNTVKMESEKVWQKEEEPEILNDYYHSDMHITVCELIHGYVNNSREIGLEQEVVSTCADELKHFSKQFQTDFREWSGTPPPPSRPPSLRVAYVVTYVNGFSDLTDQVKKYEERSPVPVGELIRELEGGAQGFTAALLDQLMEGLKPYMRRMMTRKWLTTDTDFQKIVDITEEVSQHYRRMKPPYMQGFVNDVHYHLAKQYISQVLKNDYSCKNRKHEKAAAKMRQQWEVLDRLFDNLGTTCDWLRPVGVQLCDIIGTKNRGDIKNGLQPLVQDYPDISKKHVSAVLYFRGPMRRAEKRAILSHLKELQSNSKSGRDPSRAFFSTIEVPSIDGPLACVPCGPNLPFGLGTR